MKRDIESRGDITIFIAYFYEQVKKDETIGFIFNDIVQMNWDLHIPLIIDFWETILLDNPVYKKNAMEVHFHINKILPLTAAHFSSWLLLFNAAVDEHFQGKIAELAKTRAKSIAGVMAFKMKAANQ